MGPPPARHRGFAWHGTPRQHHCECDDFRCSRGSIECTEQTRVSLSFNASAARVVGKARVLPMLLKGVGGRPSLLTSPQLLTRQMPKCHRVASSTVQPVHMLLPQLLFSTQGLFHAFRLRARRRHTAWADIQSRSHSHQPHVSRASNSVEEAMISSRIVGNVLIWRTRSWGAACRFANKAC